MSLAAPAWTVAGLLLAAAAVVLLARQARQGAPGYRWLAVAAAAWGVAFVAQVAGVGSGTPTAFPLSLADLLAIAALPALAVGLLRQAPPGRQPGWLGVLADGGLMSLGLFAIAWITVLRGAYDASDVGSGTFVVDLIHPVADLTALGVLLAVALRAARPGRIAYLALVLQALGDLLAVSNRAVGTPAGAWPQLAWLLAICVLGSAGLPWRATAVAMRGAEPAHVPAWATTTIGLTTAAVAGFVSLVFAFATWGHIGPGPLIAGCLLTLAVAARAAGLMRQTESLSALAAASGAKFLQLADRTSDVVLLCDAGGLVTYASRAVSRYGYAPGELTDRRIADLVHPDDQPNAVRLAATATASDPAQVVSLDCRVRAADGTWRHVQATLSRYAGAGRDAILVTARDVSDQVALRRQVTHLTFHDGLTGLPNRAYLEERLKDLLARNPDAAVGPDRTGAIFVDLDGFTAINDSVGHGAGDLLLAQVGRRLRGLVPAHDTVARWGGDEFAILVERSARSQEIVDIAERLAGSIAAAPFLVADREITMTASLGVAFADPEMAQHLLRNADLAMARAKEAGGGRVEVFAAHMHADVIRRLELATDLRQAIADDALDLEYQPLVELATARIVGVEALVRWSRAGVQVPPAEFLSVAEESGLIIALGDLVLREACQQAARWRAAGWHGGLSVNFSLRQVSAMRFAESVLTTLDECGLPRAALTLELTERVLIDLPEPAFDELARLRQLGVRLAIDDFGTGYASLAYLRQLPVDIIKIDPSFVAGLGTDGTLAMLTRTIVQVGHDLGIEIVAEGIERPEQLELLRAMGCGLGQGYLVASPQDAAGLGPALLAEGYAPAGGPQLAAADPDPAATAQTG